MTTLGDAHLESWTAISRKFIGAMAEICEAGDEFHFLCNATTESQTCGSVAGWFGQGPPTV
jgi:hypothetical protein